MTTIRKTVSRCSKVTDAFDEGAQAGRFLLSGFAARQTRMPSSKSSQRRTSFQGRSLWTTLHFCVAAFLAPVVVLMAVSGGLYLLGIKGKVTEIPVPLEPQVTLDSGLSGLEAAVRQLLADAGVEHRFEYLKREDGTLITRPTSRVHYAVHVGQDGVRLTRNEPNLQKRLIELQGHGPTAFKTLQKVTAAGLVVVVSTGFWLGLSAGGLRMRMAAISAAGLLLFLVLAFVV